MIIPFVRGYIQGIFMGSLMTTILLSEKNEKSEKKDIKIRIKE